MNKHIKQCWDQAVNNDDTWDGHIKFMEKFAELIVEECADYVQFYYKDHACEIIAHDMKQHFGVEE